MATKSDDTDTVETIDFFYNDTYYTTPYERWLGFVKSQTYRKNPSKYLDRYIKNYCTRNFVGVCSVDEYMTNKHWQEVLDGLLGF